MPPVHYPLAMYKAMESTASASINNMNIEM